MTEQLMNVAGQRKTMFGSDFSLKFFDVFIDKFNDLPALFTNKMIVVVIVQTMFQAHAPFPNVQFPDQTVGNQYINRTVNRRSGNGISTPFQGDENVVGIAMPVGGFDFIPDGLALPGMSHPFFF